MDKNFLLNRISNSIINMKENKITELCKEALSKDIPANEIVIKGLTKGMNEVIILFEDGEYFLPEVLICSDIFYKGLKIIEPYLIKNEKSIKVVLGVVEGDMHYIGKNLVKIMMEFKGIDVYDLGSDVPLYKFIETAEEIGADIIAMSTLMTTTMENMKLLIDKLIEKGIRDKYKIMIGGAPVSEQYAKLIGADLYTNNAIYAAKEAEILFNNI